MTQNTITIHRIDEIQRAYGNSIDRLGLSDYSLEVEGEKHPIDIITHPYVLLARMAMRAEETALLVFGARIFPEACFITNTDTPTGMILEHFESLGEKQMMDKNVQEAMSRRPAELEDMTIGHRELIIEASITDSLEIDKELKIVKIKPHAFILHNLYRNGPRFETGMGLPLMSPEMIAINEMQGWLLEEIPAIALNKAREKAEELFRAFTQRKELSEERKKAIEEAGYDVDN